MMFARQSTMLIIDDNVELFNANSRKQACGDVLTWNL